MESAQCRKGTERGGYTMNSGMALGYKARVFSAALMLLTAGLNPVFPDSKIRVKSLEKDGSLRSEAGERMRLAGIELPEESIALLSVLLGGKDIEVTPDTKLSAGGNPETNPVYLSVSMAEIDVPFAQAVPARERKIMINELLLALGAARLQRDADFDFKESFAQRESEAREKGLGIWSYESEPLGQIKPDAP
ncbi:MAG: hypothetical protein FGM27_02560 [Candidatus Omnitrophica bacterium]|nr:hypothetical protein [Candidatus Omnitrophota bacterium]